MLCCQDGTSHQHKGRETQGAAAGTQESALQHMNRGWHLLAALLQLHVIPYVPAVQLALSATCSTVYLTARNIPCNSCCCCFKHGSSVISILCKHWPACLRGILVQALQQRWQQQQRGVMEDCALKLCSMEAAKGITQHAK